MMTANPELKIVQTSFSEKFKSKNGPTISGVQTLLTALPILNIGDVDDFSRLHPSEDEYWTCELCFVSVPVKGAKRNLLHVIDDDLAVQHLPARRSGGIGWRWPVSRKVMRSFSVSTQSEPR